jgi:hypothetical protein
MEVRVALGLRKGPEIFLWRSPTLGWTFPSLPLNEGEFPAQAAVRVGKEFHLDLSKLPLPIIAVANLTSTEDDKPTLYLICLGYHNPDIQGGLVVHQHRRFFRVDDLPENKHILLEKSQLAPVMIEEMKIGVDIRINGKSSEGVELRDSNDSE